MFTYIILNACELVVRIWKKEKGKINERSPNFEYERFLVPCFARADLQNYMVSQALGRANDFPVGLELDILRDRKNIHLSTKRERGREREREREIKQLPAPKLSSPSLETSLGSERTLSTHLSPHTGSCKIPHLSAPPKGKIINLLVCLILFHLFLTLVSLLFDDRCSNKCQTLDKYVDKHRQFY